MSKKKKPLHYKIPEPKTPPFSGKTNRPQRQKTNENLTGFVDGQKASDIEERFARSLAKNRRVDSFVFQPSYIAGRNMPGEIRLDFMVYSGMVMFPIQVDGAFAHKTIAQKSEDANKDAILNDHLRGSGAMPVERVDGTLLETQDDSDRWVFGKW